MTQQLVYTLDDLADLPLGTVVKGHRNLAGGNYHSVVVRQPSGWYGAWDEAVPVEDGLVIPCTVLARGAAS